MVKHYEWITKICTYVYLHNKIMQSGGEQILNFNVDSILYYMYVDLLLQIHFRFQECYEIKWHASIYMIYI